MHRQLLLLLAACSLSISLAAQDTFSMIAVDTVTGEVGAAGASCVSIFPLGPLVNRLVPGTGAITVQSYLNTLNRDNAASWMQVGVGAQKIVDSLYTTDSQNNPEVRQNLAIDFNERAVYTGTNCLAWAGDRKGPNYVIAGNILLGPEILDSMEIGFNSASGTLADKLMAALNRANVPGADTRCGQYGTSSLSAFIRVASPTDQLEDYSLDLNTYYSPQAPGDPIALLNQEYQNYLDTGLPKALEVNFKLYPNPGKEVLAIALSEESTEDLQVEVFDLQGKVVKRNVLEAGQKRLTLTVELPAGVYAVKVGNQVQKWLRH